MPARQRSLRERVRLRAGSRCEYCQLPETRDPLPFHVEHIVPKKHRGTTTSGNLALACPSCNLAKASNVAGIDVSTGRLSRLYHPRSDHWAEHFAWDGPRLIGLTAIGRTTVAVLVINEPERVRLRELLIRLHEFPIDARIPPTD